MKKIILFLLISFVAFYSYADEYKILEISNASYIKINGKNMVKGDVFSGNATIGWTAENQFIAVKNLTRTESIRKFYRNKFATHKVQSIGAYLLKIGSLNTREAINLDIPWTAGKNKGKYNEKRIALVIGNSNYDYLRYLDNAVPDAKSIASKLNEYGFDVGTCFDGNIADMKHALSAFSKKAKGYDIALFYYAGHGIQDKETNISYMLPLDIDYENDGGDYISERSCLSALDIRDQIQKAKCRANILLFDACRSNTDIRGYDTGIFSMEAGPKTLVMYSTANGNPAIDRFGNYNNGPFAYAFTKCIEEPGVPLPMFIKNVQIEVKRLTHDRQIPNPSGDNIDEVFYLNGARNNNTNNNGVDEPKALDAQHNVSKKVEEKNNSSEESSPDVSTAENVAKQEMLVTEKYKSPSSQDIQFIPISGQYKYIYKFKEGVAVVSDNKGQSGFINDKGELIFKTQYEMVFNEIRDNRIPVRQTQKSNWTYIDKIGNTVISELFELIGGFSEGLANVKSNGKWKYIDPSGNTIIQCQYDEVQSFSEGFAIVKKDDKYGYIDKTGKEIIKCQFDDAMSFSEGLAAIELEKKWGFINKKGNIVIPPQYEWAAYYYFHEGLSIVKRNGKFGYIDKTGKEAISCQFDQAHNFSNGLARIEKNGFYGFIDKTGKEVISCRFIIAKDFSEGLAYVSNGRLASFINTSGKLIMPYQFDYVDCWGNWGFSEGKAAVRKDGSWYILKIKK